MQDQGSIRGLAFGLIFSVFFSAAAFAQANVAATATLSSERPKIATVNVRDAILSTDEAKKELTALQQRFAPKQNELKRLADELDALKESIMKDVQNGKLSEDEQAARVKDYEDKQKALQRQFEDTQSELQQAQQEMGGRIGNKMQGVVERYAHDHGYWMVLDVSAQQSQLVWAEQSSDITTAIVSAYNAQFSTVPSVSSGASVRIPAPEATAPKASVSTAPSAVIKAPSTVIRNP